MRVRAGEPAGACGWLCACACSSELKRGPEGPLDVRDVGDLTRGARRAETGHRGGAREGPPQGTWRKWVVALTLLGLLGLLFVRRLALLGICFI